MNPALSEVQISLIEHKLTALGLEYLPLKSEYLDHICCQIETALSEGQTFEQATYVIFEAITKDELKELQEQTILFTNQKSRRMKNLMFVFTFSILFMTGGLFFLKGEKNIAAVQLPAPEVMAEIPAVSFLLEKNMKICEEDFLIRTEEKNQMLTMQDPPEMSPLKEGFKMTSGFGMRMHPKFKKKKFHKGIDFKAPKGTPVLATANGIVFKTKKDKSGYGHHIIIKHDEQFKTLYAHLSEIMVVEGQAIQKGVVIGTVGSTGVSSKPHLHYEVIKEGKHVDPMAYCKP